MENQTLNNFFGETINVYTRTQAFEDGVLVDISNTAREAGFTISVAATHSVWNSFIAWTDKDTQQQTYQDTDGRLWDVLSMLRFAIGSTRKASRVHYKLNVVPRDGKTKKANPCSRRFANRAGCAGRVS